MRLSGPRVTLREYEPVDAHGVLAWSADPWVTRYLTWGTGEKSGAERFVRRAGETAAQRPRDTFELAIAERDGGALVGGIRMSVRDWQHRRADIGWVLRRDRWGRGYATEAASLLLRFGFDFGMHRIEAECHPDNAASARVMEKIGMRYEGRMRGTHLSAGEWTDSLLFAALATDRAPRATE